MSPTYRASRADRSFPRSGCSRTQGQGAWSCGEFGMPYTRSATTMISFAGGSGHAPGSSHIRVFSGFLHIVQGQRRSPNRRDLELRRPVRKPEDSPASIQSFALAWKSSTSGRNHRQNRWERYKAYCCRRKQVCRSRAASASRDILWCASL